MLSSLALLSDCATLPVPSAEPIARGDYAEVQRLTAALVNRLIARDDLAGVSVALVDDQRIVWSAGFGYADVSAHKAATTDTLYRVGSVSKLFTDTAALQLVEQGNLDLDAPIRNYLPGFTPRLWPQGSPAITSRMLMTHHAGLQRDLLNSFQSDPAPRFTDVAANFDEVLDYPPGQVTSYSNLGLTVLGSVVERLSGERFEQYMQRTVLQPLGMTHSGFDSAAVNSPMMASSYAKAGHPLPAIPLRDVPAGGLNSNVVDLSHFLSMVFADGRFQGHRILQPATVAATLAPQNLDIPLDFDLRMGLGWFLLPSHETRIEGGGLVAWHDGALDGYRSELAMLPEQKLGVVVLTNTASGIGATRAIATDLLKWALEAKTGIRQPDPASQRAQVAARAALVDTTPSAQTLEQWIGDYTTEVGFMRISSKDGRSLGVDAFGHHLVLQQRADGRFGLSYKPLGIFGVDLGEFGRMGFSRRTVAGREVLVAEKDGLEYLAGELLPAPPHGALAHRFDRYLGTYEVSNLGNDRDVGIRSVQLVSEDERYFVEIKQTGGKASPRLLLEPLDGEHARLLGRLRDGGDMVEALSDEDGQPRVRVAGLVFKRMAGSCDLAGSC